MVGYLTDVSKSFHTTMQYLSKIKTLADLKLVCVQYVLLYWVLVYGDNNNNIL